MKFNKIGLGKKPKFSIIVLLLFVAAFVVTGAYFIFRSVAAYTVDAISPELVGPTGKTLERISGPDRYSTAVGISKKQFAGVTGGTVILATGADWPDSATGAVLARAYKGPILLTPKDSLSVYTKNELVRIRPTRVVILGGTGVIASGVQSAVKNILPAATIERIAGVNRYDTAAKIATRVYQLNGNKINDGTAFVATGTNFPDVLSAGSVAAAKGYPILYAGTTIPPETKSALTNLGITRTIVIGGTAVIPDSVKNKMPGALRIAGANRYETSVKVATWALNNISGFSFNNVGLASGENFPDALAAGPFMASQAGFLLLTPYEINSTVYNYLYGKRYHLGVIYVFGGSAVVGTSTHMKLANLIGYGYTSKQISAQGILDDRIKKCPLLAASTVDFGSVPGGYQAVAYYTTGRIVINPNHTASLTTILNHEVYHIYDYRDNGVINWGENVPRTSPDCIP